MVDIQSKLYILYEKYFKIEVQKMETKMGKKDIEEVFKAFLTHLDTFLDSNSIYQDAQIKVLFIQTPEWAINELYAKGLVKVDQFAFPMEISMDTELDVVRIDSEIFHYHLKTQDVIKFLKEHGGA